MAAEAVRGSWKRPAPKPEEVDLLICATTTPDMQFPVHRQSDLRHGRHPRDRLVRRAGGLLGLSLFAERRLAIHRQRTARKVVVVGADKMSSIIDYTTAPLVFCSATARAPCCSNPTTALRIMDTMIKSDGAGWIHLHQKAAAAAAGKRRDRRQAPALRSSGRRAVYKYAIARMAENLRPVLARNNLRGDMIDCWCRTRPTSASSNPPPSAWACR